MSGQMQEQPGDAESSQLVNLEPLRLKLKDDDSVMSALPPKAQEQATKLAEAISLDNPIAVLEYGADARRSLAAVADQMIGETRVGEAGELGAMFAQLQDIPDDLDMESLRLKPTSWRQFLMGLPIVGKGFQPLFRFLERWEKVKPKIDRMVSDLGDVEMQQRTAIEQFALLGERNLESFRAFEVMIAAAEIVVKREYEAWDQARREHAGTKDIVQLQKLKTWRTQIERLDTRILNLQVARADALTTFPMIEMSSGNAESLMSVVHELREVTIPQIRTSVALGIAVYNQRKAAAFLGNVDQLNRALREQNMKALGAAQEEIHETEMRGARQAEEITKTFQELVNLAKRGAALMDDAEKQKAAAREALKTAEEAFKEGLGEALEEAAGTKDAPPA